MDEVKLTSHQRDVLNQLRYKLADLLNPYHTDAELVKWLRAGNFDLKKAERYFRQIDLHRKMYDADSLRDTYVKPKVFQEYERTWFLGFAKNGAPVRYTSFNVDLHGFLMSYSDFHLVCYFLNLMENDIKTMREQNRKTGQNHNSIIYVIDLDDYAIKDLSYKFVFEIVLEYLRIVQEYYPEIWRFVIFVNAPYFFHKLANILSVVLKKTFLDKVKIVSKGRTKEVLRKYIDDDVLPAFLGGKRVDSKGDPYCSEYINPYRELPEECYIKNSVHLIDETDPGVEVVTIRARGCYNIPLVLRKAGTTIRTEVRTENGSIGFAILFREFGSGAENEDIPESDEYIDPSDDRSNVLMMGFKNKIQCHVTPSNGICTAVKPGIYIIQFDNTSSWFGSRILYYRVTVTPPDSYRL